MQRPRYIHAFIDNYLSCARSVELFFRIPVSVTLAYAASDSDWGRSFLAQRGIIFGQPIQKENATVFNSIIITEVANKKETLYFKRTSIREAFLAYAESLRDNPLFEDAHRHIENPERFLEIIATGFETAPDKNKAQLARIFLKEYQLSDFDSWLYVDLMESVLDKT